MTDNATSFPYQEPAITTILNISGFILALNIADALLNRLLYCGLIGQLFIGVLWGTPGADWLDHGIQEVFQKLGYLGLIMLVYEGKIQYLDSFWQFGNNS